MEATPEESAYETLESLNEETTAEPEDVAKALARIECEAISSARVQARAHAAAIMASMPEWWKAKFQALANTHFNCRKGRRATAKLLREYAACQRATARVPAFQASDREDPNEHLSRVLFDRAVLGLPPPRCVSKVGVARIEGLLAESRGDGRQGALSSRRRATPSWRPRPGR